MAHDALGYFEGRFDLHAAGALADAGDERPGPARAERMRALIAAGDIVCVFTDPAHDSALARRLAEGGARATALDPLGAGLPAGSALYPEMMRRLARDMAACLGGG
jgi:zinc transport system substrate-binding protein